MKRFFLFYSTIILIIVCLMYSINSDEDDVIILGKTEVYSLTLSGAVLYPGVYEISSNQYIIEVVSQVGLRPNSITKDLNLYVYPESNMKLEIPFGIININTADLYELDYLDGVGATTAQKIIDYRLIKPFSSIEELRVIGNSIYEKNSHRITI